MPDANFVCSICSQTFTRRWRGKTHNVNLHSGSAKIVRLIDYMFGRLNGQYFPGDPSMYRTKKANVFSHESNSTAINHDRVFKTSTWGANRMAENTQDLSHFRPVTQSKIQQNTDLNQEDSSSDLIEKKREAMFKEIDGLNLETREKYVYGFPVPSARLEEAKKLLMLFSPPGENLPAVVEKTLAGLSSRILKEGGDDSFLTEPLKEMRNCVSLADAVGLLESPLSGGKRPRNRGSELHLQEDLQVYGPSAADLPDDATEKLKQIEELLSPFHPQMFIQNKIKELVRIYCRTGDSSIFGSALAHYLNNPR